MERLHDDQRWGATGGHGASASARPIPEDYGLTPDDLRIWYAPGRAGAVLAVLATTGTAVAEAIAGARHADPWILGAVGGLFHGGLLGGFAGLGLLVLVHWCDPLIGRAWPEYARLRRYRDALASARAAGQAGS